MDNLLRIGPREFLNFLPSFKTRAEILAPDFLKAFVDKGWGFYDGQPIGIGWREGDEYGDGGYTVKINPETYVAILIPFPSND